MAKVLCEPRMEESYGAMIKLNSSYYLIWKLQIEDVLYTKDLHLFVYSDSKKPKDKNDDDWNIFNRKTIALIQTWVDQV